MVHKINIIHYRVGYFVNNEYESDELRENPPETPNISVIHRKYNLCALKLFSK